MIPVILSGGSGSRLWPLSRSAFPKQFLALCGKQSMLQSTVTRLQGSVCDQAPIFVTNNDQRFLLAEQVRSLGIEQAPIILEPCKRNTAPAIALACLQAIEQDPEAVLLVLPSDHHMQQTEPFHRAITQAEQAAQAGHLVTFGIVPTKPETGYGYICAGESKSTGVAVKAFVEKPSLEKAQSYLEAGNYYWNSGMFAFRADVYLAELGRFNPEMLTQCKAAWNAKHKDLDFLRIGEQEFEACPEDSIDYAVMEKTDKAVVIPLDCGWSDVGSWQSLWEVSESDEQGNVFTGDVISEGSTNCMVVAENRLVSLLGLQNVVVVETKDAVLVADLDKVQDVKKLVETLKKSNRSEHEFHREVHRPWGKYDSVDSGERYQVKRITVKPGAKLSTQMHHHRAEHWVVVKGTAKVGRDKEELMLSENESVYLPLGAVHYLENPGKIPLEIIEIQSGSYLGEDDIVRFKDNYGRTDS